jgi:hypothetical protein
MVPRMTEEHLPSAVELIQEADKYRAFYQNQLRAALTSANGARIMLKKIEILTQQDSEIRAFQTNGYPEPKPRVRHEREDDHAEAAEHVPVTRKPQVLGLLGQVPGREWSVRQIAETLGIDNLKSLRVTLDEMAKAGTLVKTPEARYMVESNRTE